MKLSINISLGSSSQEEYLDTLWLSLKAEVYRGCSKLATNCSKYVIFYCPLSSIIENSRGLVTLLIEFAWNVSCANPYFSGYSQIPNLSSYLYPRPTKLGGGVYWIHLVRPSVRPSVRLSVDDMVSGA